MNRTPLSRFHPALLSLCATCLAVACAEEPEAESVAPAVEVTTGPLRYTASFHGELKAALSEAIHAPELSGIDFLTVDTVLEDGTMVKEGDVVLTFVRGPLEDDLRARETALAVSKAELQRLTHNLDQEKVQLDLDVKRKQMALERARLFVVEGVNLISELELNKYKLDVQRARVELDLARKALRAYGQKRETALEIQRLKTESKQREVDDTRANLEKMSVTSPTDGMLYGPYTRLNWVRGKVAAGSVCRPGDKLLEVPELETFQVEIYVRQRDAKLLNLGDEATVSPSADPAVSIPATIVKKDDVATTRNERLGTELPENNLKEIRHVLELKESSEALRPGGTAKVEINLELLKDATLVPVAAVTSDSGTSHVTLASGEQVSVTVKRVSNSFAAVEGLTAGQQVRLTYAKRTDKERESAVTRPGKKGGGDGYRGKRRGKRPKK